MRNSVSTCSSSAWAECGEHLFGRLARLTRGRTGATFFRVTQPASGDTLEIRQIATSVEYLGAPVLRPDETHHLDPLSCAPRSSAVAGTARTASFLYSRKRRTGLRTGLRNAMVVIEAGTPLLGAIAAASAHGLTDLQRPPRELVPYALVFAPIPTEVVTPLFIGCSVQHFARDVGYGRSALLHACFISLGCTLPQLGWALFAAYYCLVHAPLHCVRHSAEGVNPFFATAVALAATVFASIVQDVQVLALTDLMQLGVVAHILVDEIHSVHSRKPVVASEMLGTSFREQNASGRSGSGASTGNTRLLPNWSSWVDLLRGVVLSS